MNTKSNIILQFKKLKEKIEPLIKYDEESSRNGFNPSKMKKLFNSDNPLMTELEELVKPFANEVFDNIYKQRKHYFWFITNLRFDIPECQLEDCGEKAYFTFSNNPFGNYTTGCCLKHVRKACSIERMKKEKETIDKNGLSLIDKRVAKTAKTMYETIDENGLNGFEQKKVKFKEKAYSRNSEGKMLKDVWIEKAMETKKRIGSYKTSGKKSLEARINNIDENGLNGLERAMLNGACKTPLKKYKESSLYYQGSFELKFLEQKEIEYGSIEKLVECVKRGPTIKYFDPVENKERNYFPDFLIDDTIYEIKSSWTWNNRKKGSDVEKTNAAKLEAVKQGGFNVVLVKDGKEIIF